MVDVYRQSDAKERSDSPGCVDGMLERSTSCSLDEFTDACVALFFAFDSAKLFPSCYYPTEILLRFEDARNRAAEAGFYTENRAHHYPGPIQDQPDKPIPALAEPEQQALDQWLAGLLSDEELIATIGYLKRPAGITADMLHDALENGKFAEQEREADHAAR